MIGAVLYLRLPQRRPPRVWVILVLRTPLMIWVVYTLFVMLPTLVTAGSLASIRDRGVLAVCAHPDALPFSSQNSPQHGFELDLAEAVARLLGVRLQVNWIVFTR